MSLVLVSARGFCGRAQSNQKAEPNPVLVDVLQDASPAAATHRSTQIRTSIVLTRLRSSLYINSQFLPSSIPQGQPQDSTTTHSLFSLFKMVSNKLNAAGMAPEHSMVLPEREASQEEQMILAALVEVSKRRLLQCLPALFR